MEQPICATKEVHRPAVTHGDVNPVLSQGLPVTLLSSEGITLLSSEEILPHTALGKSEAQQRSCRGGQLICLKILQT